MASNGETYCKLPLLDGNTTSNSRIIAADVESGDIESLRALYSQDEATLVDYLYTAWGLLLRCYTGQNDVAFRVRRHSRGSVNRPSVKPSQSEFTVQLAFQDRASLSACLGTARRSQQSIEPGTSVESSKGTALNVPDRTNTIVNVSDSERDDKDGIEFDEVCIGLWVLAHGLAPADGSFQGEIILHVSKPSDELRISVMARSSDTSSGYVESLASTLGKALSTLALSPDVLLQDLDYTGQGHLRQIEAWAQKPAEQVNKCLHDIVYEQTLQKPDHEAVCAWDGTLTYRELWRHVEHLAQILCDLGVGPEVVVPLCFEKSVWTAVAMLAVMEAGGGFCLLDATQPNPRLKALTVKLGADILLCSRVYAEKVSPLVGQILVVDGKMFHMQNSSRSKMARAMPANIAYVVWTSGSTGEPKAIMIEHHTYCSAAKAHAPALCMYPDSRMLQFASYVFDASILETLTPLMIGATTCIPSEQSRLNDLPAAIVEFRVDWVELTPSVVNFLNPSAVPGLKILGLVGEVMSQENLSTWSHIKLINAYGPAECAVAAAANSDLTVNKETTLIGYSIGARPWLVDPEDHNRLVPPGCAAELVLEGPSVARGYLGDAERTAQSFIEDPAWANGQKRRMYRTGDLVRYHTGNGMMYFLGRKDTQIKLHGQRIELGEIEHHLASDPIIKQSMLIMPKSGPFKQRLVALICLQEKPAEERLKDVGLRLLNSKDESAINLTRERLGRQLPAFMVPSVWLAVESIPLLASGKLDRKAASNWVHNLKEEEYVNSLGQDDKDNQPTSDLETRLRAICGHVLNLKPAKIGMKRSFLNLGGDSISAMMVQSQCKKEDIRLTVQDILRAKSIRQLASLSRKVGRSVKQVEKVEEDFDLSPIQSLYFELDRGQGHFNQSFFVRLAQSFQATAIHQATKTIVNRHSMLRARFRLSPSDDEWKQRITTDVTGSYSFREHSIDSKDDAVPLIYKSQSSLDPVNGPLFSVDLFNIESGGQLLFMTAHHLVVDLVSWRVILQDLEDILTDPKAVPDTESSLSFQTWSKMQIEHAHSLSLSTVLPPVDIPQQEDAYWGMRNRPNLYGDVEYKGFELDASITALIVGKSHEALRTDTVDILVAAMSYSYSQIFTDREAPTVFNEGHGREVWDDSIDLSRTVGWFTTMYPIHVPITASAEFMDVLQRVKDFRRSVPANGRPYFASRMLTTKGSKRFRRHWPLEITFNYLGVYQQLEREDALLRPVEEMAGEARGAGGKADVGFDTPRFGLFEISAVVAQGKLRFSFTFNRHMRHQQNIIRWIETCQNILATMPQVLARMTPQPTLSDYPLLTMTYESLKQLVQEKLPSVGIAEIGNVEDIYRCSQIQQGLLISTEKDAGFYAIEGLYKVRSNDGTPVDSDRIASAWQKVVDRHASLRTIFVDSSSEENALYDQVVLKKVNANIVRLRCGSESGVAQVVNSQRPLDYTSHNPAHRLTICETSTGQVFCNVEISHTITDGASMSIIFDELITLYEGRFLSETGPLYSNYIAFLQTLPHQAGIGYWKSYLAGIEPSSFPVLDDAANIDRQLRSKRLSFNRLAEIQAFCNLHGVTMANVFHTAWALTLQCYTGSQDVCFGYLMSTRDEAIEGADGIVGYLVNMLVCRVGLTPEASLVAIMQQVQTDFSNSQAHRHTALSEVLHTLDLGGTSLFNTSLSYRKLPPAGKPHTISLDEWSPYYDPTEYSVSINIEVSDESAAIDLDYWTDCLSDGNGENVLNTFAHALQTIIDRPELNVGQLDSMSKSDLQQILEWNSNMPETVNRCVHDVVAEQAALRPSAEAVTGHDADFTYEELLEVSGRLASYLSLYGVGPESYICLCFEKSSFTIVAMLGVLQAGGAFASLDAMSPMEALKLRIEDTGSKVILTSPCYSAMFAGMDRQVVPIDQAFLDSLKTLRRNPSTIVQPHHPCYIIYTSGSTGKPKGVVVEHRAMVTSAEAHGSALGFDTQTRTLQYASYTFDNNLEEIFTTLMRGGVVCVPSDHDRMYDLGGAVQRLQANFIDLTPTVATYLNPSDMPSLTKIGLGGEALTKAVLEVWGDKGVEIHNQYGPSECTINATHRKDIHKESDTLSLGRSTGSVSWIVDPSNHNRLLPIGREGELLIEGPILARGYLNDPEKTAGVFIENPDWAMDSRVRRMYKTGDIVRYNSDGTLAYLGRKDQQVKLHGQRIELGEIEYHVRANLEDDWRSAIELIIPGNGGESSKALAVFLCPQTDGSASASAFENGLLPLSTMLLSTFTDLEVALTKVLPKHMVPSMYIPCTHLPVSSSGKLDRKQLRVMAKCMTETQILMYRLSASNGREPSTELEKTLAGLWETILSLGPGVIGMDAQFFRMGGDSIAAIRLVTAARSKGISLTVANIFREATLSEMCKTASFTDASKTDHLHSGPQPFELLPSVLPKEKMIEEVSTLCKIEASQVEDIYPCTTIQEGLMALSTKQSGAYVAQNVYSLASIDISRFKAAWDTVLATEPILRTRIVYIDSLGFLQVVVKESIEWTDAARLEDLPDSDKIKPAYNGGKLSGYALVKNVNQAWFVWTVHHALYDGWSLELILNKVQQCYEGSTPTKSPNETSFANFIRYVTSIDAATSEEFWRSRLSETASPQYPALPKPAYQPHVTGVFSHSVPITRASGSQITLASLVRAAWALTISAYCNSEDVVFGETVTGRDVPVAGILDLTGPTLATIPVRVQAKRDVKIHDFLKQLQDEFTEGMPYQHMGLQRIKRINADTATACDFQNLIAINSESADSGSDFWKMQGDGIVGSEFYTYVLTVAFDVSGSKVKMIAHYDPEVLPDWQLQRLIHYFDCALTRLASKERTRTKLSEIQTISTQDQELIEQWNDAAPTVVQQCIHEYISTKSEGAAPAIFAWDAQFTYQELETVATSFACHLQDIGVKPQSYIPVCFEKSAVSVIAMLAILKVGAAFVPIDGASPEARLRSIVSDVDANLVLCSPKYHQICNSLGVRSPVVDLNLILEGVRKLTPLPRCASNEIAYLIFTSGSTGKPKGTMVSHAAFASGAVAHAPAMGLQQSSRVLQFSSYTFDASVVEIFTTLMMGGCICIPDDETRLNNVAKAINDMKVNWTLLTPSFVQTVSPSDVPGLKTLVFGGEAVSRHHVSAWVNHLHLVNAYGPSECAVIATINSHVTSTSDPSNIGHAVGGHCFVVNQNDHNVLVPVGAIGELVVIGPILARGYLKDQVKTEQAFVPSPQWVQRLKSPGLAGSLAYKTGDLVRYTEDGSFLYVGRKDNQTKLHGQRLELGEVEHHMGQIPSIQHSLATIPSRGLYEKKLVGVIAFKERTHSYLTHGGLNTVARDQAEPQIRLAKDCLSSRLPPYMVPSNWILLKEIPLLPSGKLDRRQVKTWIEDMPEDVFRVISGAESDDTEIHGSEVEQRLQLIWSKVLHLPPQQVGLDKHFLYLGGDSISALQVASQCRSQGLGVTVQDIIRCSSIADLATRVTLPKLDTQFAEQYEEPFELAPIQRLFFEWVGDDYQHFNQSIALRLSQRVDPGKVSTAVEALANTHSMLRARFEKRDTSQWSQTLAKDCSKSLRFTSHIGIASSEDISSVIAASQSSLDIQSGPLSAVDLFESDESGLQVLSFVIHHLSVDVVSWGIILDDLEKCLVSQEVPTRPSLSFQVWSRLQQERVQSEHQTLSLGAEVPSSDYSYWNITERSNTYGAAEKADFVLDEETTRNLSGPCNRALNSELIDTLLGSILHSFCRSFPDRQEPPAVFNEAHGREPWDASLDLSQTVGWFTTISPVFLPAEAAQDDDVVNTIRWVKDQRSRTKSNGRPYFAHRMLTEEGRQQSAGQWPIEIAFNYLGRENQFKKTNALFQPLDDLTGDSDIGASVPRFALFEISASISDDHLKVSLQFPRAISRQDAIRKWATQMEGSLLHASKSLLESEPQSTLSSFDLVPLAYNGINKIQARLPSMGVSSMAELEDIYGCSSMQQGLLLSQIKNTGQYMYHTIFAVNPTKLDSRVSSERLARAWAAVVQKHTVLRTVFFESISRDGLTDQAVLKKHVPRVEMLHADAANAVKALESKPCISFSEPQPHHRLTICETNSERMFCKLELSHALCDGTSIPIVFQDLAQAYMSQSAGLDGALAYRDYVAYLQRTSRDEDAVYWRRYLQNIEPCHFPALTDTSKDERQLRTLELELRDIARLQSFCSQRGVTLSTALQFVWALVLRAYTGNQNVCFGYLSSGRDVPIEGIENAVGLFISMLVCRMDCDDDLLVSTGLEQIRNDYTQSMSHQAFSLGDMQHELQLAGKSLFNTAFTYQRRPPSKKSEEQELTFDILEAYDPSEYDLTVNVEVHDTDAVVCFNHWTDFICDSQAKNIADTFHQVLSSLIATVAPERTLAAIEYCGASNKRQIVEWNHQSLPNVDRCVHAVIKEQSRILPLSTPAVCSWDGDLTYTKLISLSSRLAQQLSALGVGPESYIPICFEKSLWAVVAMLGILQAGGAFVPLEPTHPESRLKFIIKDVGAQLILSSRKHSGKFAGYPGVLTHVVDKSLEKETQPLLEEKVSPSIPSNAAYLIFTSGTTGLPKGTIISHQAFTTSATEHAPRILMKQSSRVLQFSNLCFDASIMEILSSLIAGACVCIPRDEERMNDISGAIRRMSVNWTLLTPSVAEVLDPEAVPSLRTLVTGGEAMQARHIAKWSGKASLVNAYGPSECAVIATTSLKVDEQRILVDDDPTVIGHAVGCRSWIVNPQDHNQLMPIGSVGELIIEGNTVARGYLNNEEKTAKSFVARPSFLAQVAQELAGDPTKMIYKTGDLVRYRFDGSIIYVARKDTQIKLNGLRIELGEIEHHVKRKLPENVQTAVEMVAPAGNRRTLAAFFCSPSHQTAKEKPAPTHPSADESGDLDEETLILPMSDAATELCRKLKTDLAGSLPAYMIPSLFVPLARMPWTASGKLDRTRLCREITRLSAEETAPFKLAATRNKRGAATEMESRLQKLWERVLNLRPGSANLDDSFFVVGGDSVQAMKLVARAREELISLSVLDIFRKPTLAEMASACSLLEEGDQSVLKPFGLLANTDSLDQFLDEIIAQCRIEKDQLADAYPCSALQEGLITLSIKQPGAYVANNVFRLPEAVDTHAFKAAWERAIKDMDILRTRIVHTSTSTFVQAVLKNERIEWHSATSLEDVTNTEVKLPEHSGSPLMRFTLVESTDRYFVWSIHHALYDGWSMPKMLQRVEDIYFDDSPPLPKTTYAQFIKYVAGQDSQVSDRFWRSKFDGLQSIHFPRVSSADGKQEGSTDTLKYTVKLPPKAINTGITLPTMIRAAWGILLAAHTGSEDVVFGETMTGRDIPVDGVIDMLGPTLTTVPTRIQLNKSGTITDMLQKVNQAAAEIIPYQHVGMQNIRRLSEDTAMACDFQNLLVIQTAQGKGDSSKLWDPQNTGVGSNFFTYPLVVECNADEASIDIEAHYNEHVISKWHVQRLLFQLERILSQICLTSLDSQVKLSDVQVISQQDMGLISQWNDYESVTVKACIHELFLQQAEVIPNSPAVSAWDGNFTYKELSMHAEKLSNYLQRHFGVSPEVLVPFCMDKSRWALVAQMGVLMAGGAIVPLDPAHPVSRHAEIIKDSQASILLCSPAYQSRYTSLVNTVIPIDEQSIAKLRDTDGSDMTLIQAESNNTAYVIFTSGSTGRPKGVVVEHQAFCSSSMAYCEAMLMLPSSRVFNFASVTFDVGLMENLSPLTIGACVCVPNNEAKMADLASAINSLAATWAFLTPSVANLIDPAAVPSLKTLVCGGEAMSKENVLKWADSLTLVNGYGPTEAAVISVVNSNTSQEKDSSNIGYAHDNCYAWIAEADDHNRLAPLGCAGELLLGGPLLAREYLHDEAKTAAAFINSPSWAANFSTDPTAPTRIYKTGDLVKYAENGSITFIGRKDNQIKLNGNRIELGEIEHKSELHPHIRHAVAIVPKAGFGKARLVAVVSLSEMCSESQASAAKECVLLQGEARVKKAQCQLQEVRTFVSDRLPVYMVPTMWIAVEAIPLLVSGKLDRKQVERWIEKFDNDQYLLSTANDSDSQEMAPITETVQQLREIWSLVFNTATDNIDPSKSFMSQGGDSLISMSIIARLRKTGIVLSLQEILQSKSLFQLANLVDSRGHGVKDKKGPTLEEKLDEPFDLSPVQRMYFELAGPSSDHTREERFNQSQLLRLNRKTGAAVVQKAIDIIVQHHSMFRARFSRNQAGVWQQRIVNDVSSAYSFTEHHLQDASEMLPLLATSQTSLNIEEGPVFAVSLYNTESNGQILSLIAHHLVIDVVSWNILLQQLEDLLTSQTETIEKPMSFQVWNAMQISHATQREASRIKSVLPFNIRRADMAFWDMADRANTYADVKIGSFSVDKATTQLALGKSNSTLRTQPVELFLTALFHSFKQVFPQRVTPTIFNESHGRDAWDGSIDITQTTGWFTSIFPLHLAADQEELSKVDILKRVKDLKRSIPSNGRDYFAHRYLTPDGRWRFGDHMPMEILLNYTGQSQQQSGHNASLFAPFDIAKSEVEERLTADVGPKTTRMALFEISIGASNNEIHFSFMYNKNMQHQGAIEEWIKACHTTLKSLVTELAKLKPEASLSDFPLLPTDYNGLTKHLTETFPEVGIKSLEEVEDIYVTAPTQEGLLLSQIRNPDQYVNFVISEVFLPEGKQKVDVPRLVRSWQKVVDRHQSMRTAFVYSVCKGHAFDQIALKQAPGGAKTLHCGDDDFEKEFEKVSLREVNKTRRPMLPHQFSICTTTSGKTYCKLELNHAVIDGGSGALITRDLALAYENRLPDGPKPLYSDYVKYINSFGEGTGTTFWKNYLHGIQRCYIPKLNPTPTAPEGTKKLNAIYLQFNRFPELQTFCRSNEFTLSNVMLTAWGYVLRRYTSMDHVCFGNLTAGRDAPVDGIQDTVGAFINMLVCRVNFAPTSTLIDLIRNTQSDYLNMLPHQHVSLAKMQHDLGFTGESLFNTAVSIQNQMSTRDAEKEGDALEIEPITDHDPTEVSLTYLQGNGKKADHFFQYAVTVNIRSAPGDEGARIKHWTSLVSVEEGEKLTRTYAEVLGMILDGVNQTVVQLDSANQTGHRDLKTMMTEKTKRTPTFREPAPPPAPATEDTASTLEEEPQPTTAILQPHVYRSLIKETVRETIEQLIRSGELIRPNQAPSEATVDFEGHDQYTSAHGIEGYDFGNGKSREGSYTETFSYEATSTTLRELWSSLLDIPPGKIYDDDSFFDLGGDSIVAMELAKSTRDSGLSLTVADIFGFPTFSDMVYALGRAEHKKQTTLNGSDTSSQTEHEEIDEMGGQEHFSLLQSSNVEEFLQNYICPKIGIFRGGIVDAFPVTDFQALAVTGTLVESRWMLNYFTFDGDGALDLGRFRRAASQLVSCFDILRTVFVPCGNRFLQVVLRTLQPQVQVFDTELDFDEFTMQLRDNSQHVSPRLGEPYTQFTIIRKTGTRAHRIVLRLSHAQYDGVCLPYILDAFRTAYENKNLQRSPPFARYVKEAFASSSSDTRGYWKGLLENSSMTEIVPRQTPKYDSPNVRTTTLSQTIRLPSLSSRNITEATILKAAWALTLAQLSGNSDVVFGNLISGRNVAVDGVESIVGPCVNIIPVRIKLEPKWTALELLRKVQSQQVAGMPYESLGFREIVQNCTSWPEWTYFSTIIQHQNLAQETELCLDRISYKVGAQGSQENLADLTLVSAPKGGEKIEIGLGFVDDGSISRQFVQDALDSFCSLATNLVRNPMVSIMDTISHSSIAVSLTQHQRQPTALIPTSATRPTLDRLLRDLSKRELNDIADTLARAWRLVLPTNKQRSFILNLDSSFYESGGDLISLASLAAWLEGEEGVGEVRLEELIQRPTMGEQVALLWKLRNKKKGESSETLIDGCGANRTEDGVVVPKDGEIKKKGLLRRGMGVVRKLGGGKKKEKERKEEVVETVVDAARAQT